jgi:CRP-like cAMP-binding protein
LISPGDDSGRTVLSDTDAALERRDDAEVIARYFERFAQVARREVESFVAKGRVCQIEAGQPFCELGQRRHELGFIRAGILRYHVTLANGEEATKDFSFAGTFAVSFGSASMGRPAEVAISAVVATELRVWPYETLLALYESGSEGQRLGRRIAELLYVRKERRELSFLLEDAQTRYLSLREQLGHGIDAIPQYHLASYLGIRPPSLSRLRKRIADSPG